MAFNRNAAAQQQQNDDNWKAAGFLNFYIKREDGSKAKIGAIPLKDTRGFDKALIARLKEDGAIDDLMQVLEIDFREVDNNKPANVGF